MKYLVHERIGNFSRIAESCETHDEAVDYLMARWEEARGECLEFHQDFSEDVVQEDFMSYFSIEEMNV